MSASLVILNARVITLSPKRPRASAVAVENDRIVAVGTNSEIRKHVGNETEIIDLKQGTVVPGLVDCHVHMLEFGFSLRNPDLRDARSISEMQRKLEEYAAENYGTGWILGGRWDHEKFAERRYPTRWDLDSAVADRPVFLVRVCGHIGVANSESLRLAGITKETVVPGGRIIIEEKTGEPNGIVEENALSLVWKVVPKPSPRLLEEVCISACQKAVEAGLTGVHWLVESTEELQCIEKLNQEGKLPLRVYLGLSPKILEQLPAERLTQGFKNGMMKIGFVKIFADGSLGGHTAALKEPYSDRLETRGMLINTQKELDELVWRVHKAGMQIGVHAIGDRAVESVLKAIDKALKKAHRKDHRHRIEHCSVLNPSLIKDMKRLGMIASVQPHFVVSDSWTIDRLGKKRIRWAYPFKTLMEEGVVVASGSDCPIEKISPLLGIWAAVTRKDSKEENLSREEALKTYTLNAASASFDEDEKGTIEPGKLADLTVLSDGPFELEPDDIRNIAVDMTVVNGRVVYIRKDFG